MVVADIAASGRAASSPSSGVGHTQRRRVSALSPLSFRLLIALGCISLSAQAAIVADGSAPGNQQPTIISSANGTPQVNIQTPSSGGVSRNAYRQFDVDNRGVILNNGRGVNQTQIAGLVDGNPWLARGEASVILNEVNSRDPSQLNGYIEVAGRKAQVVIANPAGITCEGCGLSTPTAQPSPPVRRSSITANSLATMLNGVKLLFRERAWTAVVRIIPI